MVKNYLTYYYYLPKYNFKKYFIQFSAYADFTLSYNGYVRSENVKEYKKMKN